MKQSERLIAETGLEVVSGFEFQTDGFSEFVLQYTVDFHYEIDGKMYEFSIPGGGFVSLSILWKCQIWEKVIHIEFWKPMASHGLSGADAVDGIEGDEQIIPDHMDEVSQSK